MTPVHPTIEERGERWVRAEPKRVRGYGMGGCTDQKTNPLRDHSVSPVK